MITRFLNHLADKHPRLAVALLFVVAAVVCSTIIAVTFMCIVAAASFITSLGA